MGKLFDIVKNEVQLDPNVLAVPAFNELWSRDNHRKKHTAKKELTYVVFLCDIFKSPYRDIDNSEKEIMIRADVFGPRSKWKPDEKVKEAIKKYRQLQTTRHMKLLEGVFKTEEEITKYFQDVDLSKTDDWGKPIYNMENIIRNMERVGSVIQSISKLEKQVRTELADLEVRGGSEIGYYEDPSNTEKLI